ncbi:GAP1-M domain-containing protein [Actinomadura keratinilytica]|uniref:GAP1-M domain-containing protein n=1 Tax=Actinomadura keratinilytica TaxID=547461 RepID=UPI00361B026A
MRAAELWQAPLWADAPSEAYELAALEELTPGPAMSPEALAEWLAGAPGDPYALLTRLVDAVTAVLAQGHGRVVLVASDVELTARWIAVLSYSLPMAAAARMSFVTYSADPDGAAQRLVGTTPDVWAAAQHQGTPQWFPVEQPLAQSADRRAEEASPGGGGGAGSRARWRAAGASSTSRGWTPSASWRCSARRRPSAPRPPPRPRLSTRAVWSGPRGCWRCAGATRPRRPPTRRPRRRCWRGTAPRSPTGCGASWRPVCPRWGSSWP